MEALQQSEKTKRRWRNHPQPTGRFIHATDRVVWGVLKPLYEHYHLPTPYLLPFVQRITPETSLNALAKFLEPLYHEDNTEHGGAYVRRVAEHPKLPDFSRYAIYDLTPFAEHALEEKGYQPFKRSFKLEFDPHRFMVSCGSASIEIAVNEHPRLEWESRAQILREAGTEILRFPCKISHNGYSSDAGLVPDDLFGIVYDGEYWRLFAKEDDRGNEPYERANPDETSLHAKVLRYEEVIGNGLHKHYLKRRCGLVVLFIFTTTTKQDEFLRRVEKEWLGPRTWILTTVVSNFGKVLSIPPVMRDLLTREWKRPGYKPVRICDVKWNSDLT